MGKTYRAFQFRTSPYKNGRRHGIVKCGRHGRSKDRFKFDRRKDCLKRAGRGAS